MIFLAGGFLAVGAIASGIVFISVKLIKKAISKNREE